MKNTPTVGADIYVGRFTGHDWQFVPGKVVKVTPSGRCDVETVRGSIYHFNAKGVQLGEAYRPYELDMHIPFAERAAELSRIDRAKQAARTVEAVVISRGVNYQWGKDGLSAEVARLQTLLDVARAAVESI